ncbi:Tripartite tricarboxylate transporter TctB family protein [Devosia enhydra]|uniref:Tripartite tricarboxylate transporter TctB family protein n=1 Tax=Devosia enhydra TaxID=665118 RepID=A0A1K2I198_9HYPH|nr:tripartite tricarboxylate transporter TctB family protein [Devosia enhydra]SFZ86031.1 Tripartite tricarboxylate transporter TctB family protein [Devosia enhydra]
MSTLHSSQAPAGRRPTNPLTRFGAKRLAAAVLAIVCAAFVLEASSYPYMDWLGPGSGFFPMWVGSLCLLAALGMLIFGSSPAGNPPLPTDGEADLAEDRTLARMRIGGTIVILVLTGFALQPIGFNIAAAAMITALLLLYGTRPVIAVLAGLVGAPAVFFLFAALHVRLPVGPLGF